MRKDLQDLLRGDDPMAALLAEHKEHSNVYWVSRPRGAGNKYPALVLTLIGPVDYHDQKGTVGLIKSRVQCDVFGKGDLQVVSDIWERLKVIMTVGMDTLGNPRKTVGQTEFCKIYKEDERDMPATPNDDGVDILHISGDFMIWHRPI